MCILGCVSIPNGNTVLYKTQVGDSYVSGWGDGFIWMRFLEYDLLSFAPLTPLLCQSFPLIQREGETLTCCSID